MVVQLFSEIENKNVITPRWEENPYLEDNLAMRTLIVPIKDTRSLTISFPTGDLDQYYKAGVNKFYRNLKIMSLFLNYNLISYSPNTI